jgi:hypothetical protein
MLTLYPYRVYLSTSSSVVLRFSWLGKHFLILVFKTSHQQTLSCSHLKSIDFEKSYKVVVDVLIASPFV